MKRSYASVALLGAAIGCAVACGPADGRNTGESAVDSTIRSGPEAEAQELLSLPGFATFGHEVRAFRPCGSEESLWAIDSSGVLWDLHGELTSQQEPYGDLFVVLEGATGPPLEEGFGADYAGTLVVEAVQYAAQEGFGCDYDWSRFSLRAYGNEPFWTAEASPRGFEFDRLGEETRAWDQLREEWTEDGGYLSGLTPGGLSLEVEFLRAPCRDSMSGAYFGFTVTVRIDGEEFTGCGLEGARPI